MRKFWLIAISAAPLAFASAAHADHNAAGHDHSAHNAEEHAAVSSAAAKIVDAFSVALASKNEKLVEKLLAPDVFIAESGGAERSLEEYRNSHMGADMLFMSEVKPTLQNRQEFQSGDLAVVVSEYEMNGAYMNKPVHSQSMETMVLARNDKGDWRIRHIHWSSKDFAAGE